MATTTIISSIASSRALWYRLGTPLVRRLASASSLCFLQDPSPLNSYSWHLHSTLKLSDLLAVMIIHCVLRLHCITTSTDGASSQVFNCRLILPSQALVLEGSLSGGASLRMNSTQAYDTIGRTQSAWPMLDQIQMAHSSLSRWHPRWVGYNVQNKICLTFWCIR